MLNLSQIESDLTEAIKQRGSVRVNTLRALKTRIQNEQVSKMKDLEESEILALVQSEIKRRKEAAEAFAQGGREESAKQENSEIEVLMKYMPEQVSEEEIAGYVESMIQEQSLEVKDFGKAMGLLKQHFGNSADGAVIARILKEKLK